MGYRDDETEMDRSRHLTDGFVHTIDLMILGSVLTRHVGSLKDTRGNVRIHGITLADVCDLDVDLLNGPLMLIVSLNGSTLIRFRYGGATLMGCKAHNVVLCNLDRIMSVSMITGCLTDEAILSKSKHTDGTSGHHIQRNASGGRHDTHVLFAITVRFLLRTMLPAVYLIGRRCGIFTLKRHKHLLLRLLRYDRSSTVNATTQGLLHGIDSTLYLGKHLARRI